MKFKLPNWRVLLVSLGLFLFFLVILFPFQNLKGYLFNRIFKESGIYVNSKTFGLSFWGLPGVSLGEVEIILPVGEHELTLQAKEMIVKVGIGSLFPPTPSVTVKVKELKKGGYVYLNFSQNSKRLKARVSIEELNLAQFEFAGPKMVVSGKLNLDGNLYLDYGDISRSSGGFSIQMTGLKTPPTFVAGGVIPAVTLGNLQGKGLIRNGFAELQQFQLGSSAVDLEGSITGEIKLEKLLKNSHLNFKSNLRFSEAFRKNPDSATLLSFLNMFDPQKAGNYTLQWTSTIEQATQSYFLPDALVDLFNLRAPQHPSPSTPPGGFQDNEQF